MRNRSPTKTEASKPESSAACRDIDLCQFSTHANPGIDPSQPIWCKLPATSACAEHLQSTCCHHMAECLQPRGKLASSFDCGAIRQSRINTHSSVSDNMHRPAPWLWHASAPSNQRPAGLAAVLARSYELGNFRPLTVPKHELQRSPASTPSVLSMVPGWSSSSTPVACRVCTKVSASLIQTSAATTHS
jgi:hypothetical protein